MLAGNRFERAMILFQQHRFSEAEKELRQGLALEPSDVQSLCLLALCLLETNRQDEAKGAALSAIGIAPTLAYTHYIASRVYQDMDELDQASGHIREAIALDPADADYRAVLAGLFMQQKEWQQALDMANEGLALEPENLSCLNIRSTAQTKLGLKNESYETIREALNQDPNNAFTHTNTGWGLLERGDHRQALEHFRQALMLNPNSDYAKEGLKQALKARYFFYRIFLRYAFWIGNMKSQSQWIVVLGFYFGAQIIRQLSSNYPALEPFLMPVIILYSVFAISTWLIAPISNLILRLNPYGRYALSDDEIKTSTLVGISLGSALVFGVLYLFTHYFICLIAAIFFASYCIPLSLHESLKDPKKNKLLRAYRIFLFVSGLCAVLSLLFAGGLFNVLGGIYFFGLIGFQFFVNYVRSR